MSVKGPSREPYGFKEGDGARRKQSIWADHKQQLQHRQIRHTNHPKIIYSSSNNNNRRRSKIIIINNNSNSNNTTATTQQQQQQHKQ